MDIHVLDHESLLVYVRLVSAFTGNKIAELYTDVQQLREKGALAFIIDLTDTPYIGTGGIAYLSVLAQEAIKEKDRLRVICTNPKFQLHFELSGLQPLIKIVSSKESAVEELKRVLYIEQAIPENPVQIYKTTSTLVESQSTPLANDQKKSAPLPISEAGEAEELEQIFQVEALEPTQISNAYLLSETLNSEKALELEIRHLRSKMEKNYDILQSQGATILKNSAEELLAKRTYPTREWTRAFAIRQGSGKKIRHLLFCLGAKVYKVSKGLSYSVKQALDEYELDCYFSLSILEPCRLYGEVQQTRESRGVTYQQYSSRDSKIQQLTIALLDHVMEYVNQSEK